MGFIKAFNHFNLILNEFYWRYKYEGLKITLRMEMKMFKRKRVYLFLKYKYYTLMLHMYLIGNSLLFLIYMKLREKSMKFWVKF